MGLPNPKVDNGLEELLYNWVNWITTRRFYAPPIPPNMLMLMQVDRRPSSEPPSAGNDALCAAFNLVLQQSVEGERLPFLYVYLKQYRPEPIKTLAYRLGIDSDTVYQRATKAATKYYSQSLKLAELNACMRREVDDYVD